MRILPSLCWPTLVAVHVRQSLEVAAEATALFDLTQDYAQRPLWDGLTPQARLIGEGAAGVGRMVRCPIGWGMVLDVVYVSHQRPRVAAFRMRRGPWWFRTLAGSWRFEPLEEGARTRVVFTYHLRMHPWVHGLIGPVVRGLVARQTHRRLHALKRLAEQGAGAGAKRDGSSSQAFPGAIRPDPGCPGEVHSARSSQAPVPPCVFF